MEKTQTQELMDLIESAKTDIEAASVDRSRVLKLRPIYQALCMAQEWIDRKD